MSTNDAPNQPTVCLGRRAEIRTTPSQRQHLLQHAGCARWAYNWALAQHKAAHERWVAEGRPEKWKGWPSAYGLMVDLVALKKLPAEQGGVPWMYEVSAHAPRGGIADVDRAFRNFLAGRAAYPRFKSRARGVGGFQLQGYVTVTEATIKLPNLGIFRLQPGQRGYLPLGRHGSARVSEEAGRWFVSVLERDVPTMDPDDGPVVGLDMGVARLATLSDGTVIENPRALAQEADKLRRLQRSMARKKKGSANRKKARAKVAKAHRRVRCVRSDHMHKVTTELTKRYGRIVIEDLKVANMTRAGGARKRGLNRVVLDAAFGEFRRQLEYKGQLYGCEIVAVPAAYTSQRCAECGHVDAGNRPSQAVFRCLACGHEDNADVNAARNILAAGSAPASAPGRGAHACGGTALAGLSKQEAVTSIEVVA